LQHARKLQLRYAGLKADEQALTRAEDYRRHLQVDLIDDAGLDRLAGDRRATAIEMSFPPAAVSAPIVPVASSALAMRQLRAPPFSGEKWTCTKCRHSS
jgi:hypothetical protein